MEKEEEEEEEEEAVRWEGGWVGGGGKEVAAEAAFHQIENNSCRMEMTKWCHHALRFPMS